MLRLLVRVIIKTTKMKDEAINNIIKKGETVRELTEKIDCLNAEIHGQPAIDAFAKYIGKKVRVKFLKLWDNTLDALEGVLVSANGYTVEIRSTHPAVSAGIYIERIVDFEILNK